jgi:hypothetical protein
VVGVDEEHVLEAALTAQLGPFPGVHVDLCRSDLWLFLLLTRDVWLLLFFLNQLTTIWAKISTLRQLHYQL